MSPAGLIVVQTHHLMTDGTLRIERVKSPSSQELDELEDPHGENAHGRLVVVIEIWCAAAVSASRNSKSPALMRVARITNI